ncbi:MAG TPA: PASTA domain-containing protein [Thermodesulfovibrionales bacterium]|nr:PASTA domain-containing protein [Thermodesulfovibrionales bacterium]
MNSFVKATLFFALFVALGLTFGFLTFKVLSFSRTVEVPSVMNMTPIEADRTLANAGLSLKIEGEDFDSVVPSGKIVRQDVPAGIKVKEKRAIRVVMSKGPKVSSVPLLINETLQNADAVLIQKGLRIGKVITVHSDSAERGIVIAQNPEPDDKLTDQVTVLVSAGPHDQAYTCPDFYGKQIDEVREIAKKMSLTVETQGEGTIISAQKPKPGTVIRSGDKLYLEMKEVSVP